MKAEKQIIGSLLLDQSRIDEMGSLTPEMFTEPLFRQIFRLYKIADGKEVNQLEIIQEIKSEVLSEQEARELLIDIVSEHDGGVSDEYAIKKIRDAYDTRTLKKSIDNIDYDPKNISKTLSDLQDILDGLKRVDEDVKPKSLSELAALYRNDYFKEKEHQIFIGFEDLDKAIGGMDGGDVIILAARPAMGKSALALQIMRKLGRDGFKVGYFNLEMGEKQIYERSIASASGIDMTRIRLANNFLNDEKSKFDNGNKILDSERNVYTITDAGSIRKIRQKVKEYGYQIVVVDYLQLIQPETKGNNRAVEVGAISRGLKAIAKEFNIPVIALSQLNRVSEMNKDKEPMMSELRESGDIEQDASVIIMMWNPNIDDSSERMIKVEKSRNGFTDRMKLYFDGKHMTFSSIDVNDGFKKSQEGELPWN